MAAERHFPNGRDGGPFALRPEQPKLPLAFSGLPLGGQTVPREFLEANQRSRLMAGAIELLAERGYLGTTVNGICAASISSRTTFYAQFADKQELFLAAYDLTVAWLSNEVLGAVDPAEDWPGRVRFAVTKTLELLGADNRLARLCTVEVFFAGHRAEIRHRALVDRLTLSLGVGRGERGLGADLPLHLEPTLIGGAFALIARQLAGGEGDRLVELAPELTEYLLAPYLGVEAARALATEGAES
jgi:AcrR family transcriptional regulator